MTSLSLIEEKFTLTILSCIKIETPSGLAI
ncbi:hypothetical protein CLV78_11419 [Aliiruegeria haliotis]|uniref:Uncharacterized protein n=1 Tax=Aliiruegeria haliotis TaxID=1280846 RepID=A0A2T0RGA4_9RHOB|nr:hypothetical protein CLV78_11419 [Aliiruegeria haliotis]